MQKFLIVLVVVAAFSLSEAKRFSRCGLVRELRRQGFPEEKMRDWVCLVESESSRYTDKTNTDRNGSKEYGLFQINNRYWCSNSGVPGKECNVNCSDLLTDDITDAARCALRIYKRQHFQAWEGWRNHCQTPGSLPDISSC